MSNTRRQDQLSQLITRELSDLMRTRMKDPRIGFASITGTRLTGDLRYAKVFISVLGSAEEQRETMRALRHGAGFLRHELAQRLTVRYVPEITFQLDESLARGAHVLELLDQVSAAPAAAEVPAPPSAQPTDLVGASGAPSPDERES